MTKKIPDKEPPSNTSKSDPKKQDATVEPLVKPIVVKLDSQDQILFGDRPTNEAQLVEQVQTYMAQNPKGGFILKADPQLPYSQVVKLMEVLRRAGGNRISLAY